MESFFLLSFAICRLVSSNFIANLVLSDINALILDYLLMEGYPKAAANFSKEANLRPMNDCYYVEARQEIQNAIHRGSIDEAISQINTLDPTVSFLLSRTFDYLFSWNGYDGPFTLSNSL